MDRISVDLENEIRNEAITDVFEEVYVIKEKLLRAYFHELDAENAKPEPDSKRLSSRSLEIKAQILFFKKIEKKLNEMRNIEEEEEVC